MTDWPCRLLGHRAEVLVVDGGPLRLRCVNCGCQGSGWAQLPRAYRVTQPGDEATRVKVLPFLKAKAS